MKTRLKKYPTRPSGAPTTLLGAFEEARRAEKKNPAGTKPELSEKHI